MLRPDRWIVTKGEVFWWVTAPIGEAGARIATAPFPTWEQAYAAAYQAARSTLVHA